MSHKWSVLLVVWVRIRASVEALGRARSPKLRDVIILNLLSNREGSNLWLGSRGVLYIHVDDFIFGRTDRRLAEQAA